MSDLTYVGRPKSEKSLVVSQTRLHGDHTAWSEMLETALQNCKIYAENINRQ